MLKKSCHQAEDEYAACLFNNWNFALLQDNCRDIQLWSCNDCRVAYRSWLCSQIFTRCQNGEPLQRVKTCRDECLVSFSHNEMLFHLCCVNIHLNCILRSHCMYSLLSAQCCAKFWATEEQVWLRIWLPIGKSFSSLRSRLTRYTAAESDSEVPCHTAIFLLTQ